MHPTSMIARTSLLCLFLLAPALRAEAPATAPTTAPTTQSLDARLDAVLYKLKDTGATVSARVVDPQTGTELYARDADAARIPASNLKLVSSAVALEMFGPDHTFETRLAMVGKDLWLIGTGDPATGDPQILKKYGKRPTDLLDAWASELKSAGITKIEGSLKFYDGALDDMQLCYEWDLDDLMFWYAAPIAGLNFHDNCIDITTKPAAKSGEPGTFVVDPELDHPYEIINTTTTILDGDEDWDAGRYSARNVFWIKGKIRKSREESVPVSDPGAFFADALRTRLNRAGITIIGPNERASSVPPKVDREFNPLKSEMKDVLARVNKNSQNLLAEGICKLAGREHAKQAGKDEPGSWKLGSDAAKAFFEKHGIDSSKFVMDDGSGLSRKNRVTTRLLSDLLLAMHKGPLADDFRGSLSIAGVDGTGAGRFKDAPNRVFAKTGYIGGVRSYSGYVKTDSGKWLIFSIIYNDIPGRVKPYEELQDAAVRVLMRE
jgi:serine-type D-Ala-D-Ala carboxypeptidase/endopeptidase (penicillin-binding protein 4)